MNYEVYVFSFSAFKIPTNHVLYVPPQVIHSNDHLIGTWRTMLSDCSSAPIDHVILMRESDKGDHEAIDLSFDKIMLESFAKLQKD